LLVLFLFAFLLLSQHALATKTFLCAGHPPTTYSSAAAKLTQIQREGTRHMLVLFADFQRDAPQPVPAWAQDLFVPQLPGSFTHFYAAMSFGRLEVSGQVAPRRYLAKQGVSYYLAQRPDQAGLYGQFAVEILSQADLDIDFADFDNDGPDGIPNSGDDDGFVDAVFIVLPSVPARFLLGPATGITNFSFDDPRLDPSPYLDRREFVTGDTGHSGQAIRIASSQGIVQQGRTFTETASIMAHEYGHVLGLPDLFDTDFLQSKEPLGPEKDSAGIGAWGLMGWGTLGWNGDDGPNSFSAWSRARLGWSSVVPIESTEQDIVVEEAGLGGALYRVPLTDDEYFLLEYRDRSTYYDRYIPGTGLLVWHVGRKPAAGELPSRISVDLECADGRWADAGFPLGERPDALGGGDNLDFWAHDADYAARFGGNLGDATDPFDGVRFRHFTATSNPAALNSDGRSSVRLENIRRTADGIALTVSAAPPLLQTWRLRVRDDNEDGVLALGETASVLFQLENSGGGIARQVRSVLRSDDPLLEVLKPETRFADLPNGERSPLSNNAESFPTLRWHGDFSGIRKTQVQLELYAEDRLVGSEQIELLGVSPRQNIREVTVIDTAGNGDGRVQFGEFFRLAFSIENQDEKALRTLRFSLRTLDERTLRQGDSNVFFALGDSGLARSRHAPEFLLTEAISAGERLPFELKVQSDFAAWRDTLHIEVGSGGDQTPPRVTLLRTEQRPEGLGIYLSSRWVIDASPIERVEAIVLNLGNDIPLTSIPLRWDGEQYVGIWPTPEPGSYQIRALAIDAVGNRGHSEVFNAVVVLPGTLGGTASGSAIPWERVELPRALHPIPVYRVAYAPGNPSMVYASTNTSLWRSEDGGATWQRTDLMFDGLQAWQDIHIDPLDPFTLYIGERQQTFKSRDGGRSWSTISTLPPKSSFLRADSVLPGRLYAYSFLDNALFISEDEGLTWRETEVEQWPSVLATHPQDPRHIYAGSASESIDGSRLPGTLWHSADGGRTWQVQVLERPLNYISLDTANPQALYGLIDGTLWHSANLGRTWYELNSEVDFTQIRAHPTDAKQLYGWHRSRRALWHSPDQGQNWQRAELPGTISAIALNPQSSQRALLVLSDGRTGGGLLYEIQDFGHSLSPIPFHEENYPVGTMVFTPQGQPFVSSLRFDEVAGQASGLYTSLDGGSNWVWRENPALPSFGSSGFIDQLFIDPIRPNLMLAHQSPGISTYLRSIDAGRTWQQVPSNRKGAVGGPKPPAEITSAGEGVYFLSGFNAIISRDFGETWIEVPIGDDRGFSFSAQPLTFAPDPQEENSVYSAVLTTLYHSEDNGQSWVPIGPLAPGEAILKLAFHPAHPERFYAVTESALYLSTDRAQTWTFLLKPEAGRWAGVRLRFDRQHLARMYLATSRQLYESADLGQTWKSFGHLFGGQPWFHDLTIDPLDSDLLYLSTSQGLYSYRRDGLVSVVAAEPARPSAFALMQNFPNPFNAETTIEYSLGRAGPVRLTVYNALGQIVRDLVDVQQEAGLYRASWNGRDDAGNAVGSGVYFYRLSTENLARTRALVLLK